MATLKLEPGKPETIAFKFDSGKDVEGRYGRQVAFTALDQSGRDQILYLDPEPASDVERSLQQLGIRTREYFRICKVKHAHGGTSINVERIAAPAPQQSPTASAPSWQNVAPTAAVTPAASATSERPQLTTAPAADTSHASTKFMAAYAAAIDTLVEARIYAQRKGLALEIRCEDVRCLAATIMIDSKGGAR